MSLTPRVRHSCRKGRQASAGAASAGQDSRLLHNRVYLSGILAAEPLVDQGRDGEPVVVLFLAFRPPTRTAL